MFDIEWLTKIFTNNKLKQTNKNNIIKTVSTDSRNIKGNSLFIPLKGDRFDGHDHVNEAIKNGAQAIIWDQEKPLSIKELPIEVSVFYVSDTLKALQLLAAEYRKLINPKVIGITGSNGKTTTKDLLEATLTDTYMTVATKGNLNNHIGLPLTILNMKRHTEVLILEMGMSNFGEIELLSNIAKPDIAIITNIGESHIEYLGSRKGIAQAKLEIIKSMNDKGTLVYDGDELLLKNIEFKGDVVACGFSPTNTEHISDIKLTTNSTEFYVNDMFFKVPLLGRHHAKNATFVIAVARLLNVNDEKIKAGLNQIKLTNMRFELLVGRNNTTLINDAYNASPTSMKASIEVVEELEGYKEKILVLGDILELGSDFKQYYQDISKTINKMGTISEVYTYGEKSHLINEYLKDNSNINSRHFTDESSLVKELDKQLIKDNLLFFKASRGIKLENIINQLK